jgi:hypothetical protein
VADGGCMPAWGPTGVRRARCRCSRDSVMRVVATDRTAVAATMVMTAHSGRWAAAGPGGGGGGTGSVTGPPGGGRGTARAAGAPARDAMAVTARPVAHRRMRGMPRPAGSCCGDALWWIIWVAPSAGWRALPDGVVWCPYRQRTAGGLELPWDRPGPAAWNRPGTSAGLVVEWSKAAGPGGWVGTTGGGG